MVGMGLLMLAVSWSSVLQLAPWKKQAPTLVASRTALPPKGAAAPAVWQSQSRGPGWTETGATLPPARELKTWQARALVAMTFAGWIALIAGWYTTEIGRQPWLVSGVLTAADAASQVVAPKIAFTLSLYLLLYAALIVAYVSVVFYLARHKTQADQPFGSGMDDTLNVVNYPEKETAPQGAAHA
jgi:cytochrome d ubiquinol oxidase subunit I